MSSNYDEFLNDYKKTLCRLAKSLSSRDVNVHFTPESHLVYVERVIFNPPATIVFWSDGEKTVVKAHNEEFDKEKGLAMAIAKRMLGNTGRYYNLFRIFIDNDEPETDGKV